MTWEAIQPYTDPALESLAKWIADRLNAVQADMVRRWIVSEMPSYRVEEYPLLQLHCVSSEGEALEKCKGSIRYVLINEQIRVGDEQQLGFAYVRRAIAKALREYQYYQGFCTTPMTIAPQPFRSELRSGALKLADGSTAAGLTWLEIFFDYADSADIDRIE